MSLFPNNPGLVSKLGIVLDLSASPKNLDTTGMLNGELLQYDAGSDRIIRGSQAAGAQTGLANVFTAKQTISLAGIQFSTQDVNGNPLIDLQNIGGAAHNAGAIIFRSENGLGVPPVAGAAWQAGTDTNATIPYRDFFLSKWLASNGVSDPDGIYISHGGDPSAGGNPAGIGIGFAQPNDTGLLFRLKVAASGSGGNATQGGIQVAFNAGQTGDMLAVGSSQNATQAFRIRSDGSVLAMASTGADVTTAGGSTNSNLTIGDTNNSFTSDMVGRYITGSGIPVGTTITGVTSASIATISLNATATATGITFKILGRAHQFRNAANIPLFTIGSNGTGSASAVVGTANFGIGTVDTASLAGALDIRGTIAQLWNGSGYGALQLVSSNAGGNNCIVKTNNAASLNLATNSTTRFAIGASGGLTITDANDLTLGTVTGTKIGTATGQKLGFWGTTPIVQPILATGSGHTVDDVITVLQALGLVRQA